MNKDLLISIVCLVSLLLGSTCSKVEPQTRRTDNSAPSPGPVTLNTPSSADSISYLCNNLYEIKNVPYDRGERVDDRIYSGLRDKDMKAVPCLIGKITDTTPMRDPRSAPSIPGFSVGDMAVFMLLDITGENWQPNTMFSPEYAKRWKENGVYAYKAYMKSPANRAHLQNWWKNWLSKYKAGKKKV